jgi:uncharacterized protein (TIGR02145 family)
VKNLNIALGIILAITIFSSCEDKPVPPVISTTAVTQISTIAAISGGNITDDGGALIISKGVCWNTTDNPTIDNNMTSESGESLSFTSNISQLLPSTSYYVRAYAVNSAGTSYGKSISFKTLGDKPASNSQNASNIQLTTATINGTVNPNSLETTVTFEYGITTSYGSTVVAQQSPLSGDSDANVSADLTKLTPGKTYHFRIKAENTLGINYSSDMTFTTLGSVPVTTAQAATNLQVNSATINGSVNPNYLSSTVEFEWGTTTSYGNTITPTQSPVTGSATVNVSADLSGLTPGTTYHFRINATNELGTTNSDDLSFTTLAKPIVATVSVSEITTTSALVGGNIISDFGSPITERGICWSINTNPAISDNKTISETADTAFSVNITGLTPNITYYLRAYAINGVGTGYGDELILKTYTDTITDIDENVYFTVTIGDQIWMAENLKTTKYNNGDPIGTTIPADKDITAENNPEYQWAAGNGDEANVAIYGRVYTWFTVNDNRKLCPSGWHVATDLDWGTLEVWLNNNGYKYDGSTNYEAYNKLGKSLASTILWVKSEVEGSIGNTDYPTYRNKSGFSALPVGARNTKGQFTPLGLQAVWWTSTLDIFNPEVAWARIMNHDNDYILKNGYLKVDLANSVRCIKD